MVAKSSALTQIRALRGNWRAIQGANWTDNGQQAESNLGRHLTNLLALNAAVEAARAGESAADGES